MDAPTARNDLAAIREIVERTHRRLDPHAFHYVHWGAIVLLWYPLANWAELTGRISWLLPLGVTAVALGAALSMVREIRLGGGPRVAGENAGFSRQVNLITFGSLAAGAVLSVLGPMSGVIDGHHVPIVWGFVYANIAFMSGVVYERDFLLAGVAIFVGACLAMAFPRWTGVILGPAMGLGLMLPGLRAEARTRRLMAEADEAGPALAGPGAGAHGRP